MYKDTVTLFNRYRDQDRKTYWCPTVLHGANLNIDKASIIAKYGTESKDNVVLNIRYKLDKEKVMVGDKQWLPPKEWKRQAGSTSSDKLTFNGTQEFDFFYAGEWEGEEPVSDDNYTNGFYSYMNETYDYVFAVTNVSKFSVIPHFEVMAK